MVVDRVPAQYRATGIGAFNLVSGASLLVASGAAGALWEALGASTPFQAGAFVAAVAALCAFLAREHSSSVEPGEGAKP